MIRKRSYNLSRTEKESYIAALTPELPMLRAKARVSQGALASAIGVSRQTYSAIERGNKPMSWNVYVSLLYFFSGVEESREALDSISVYLPEPRRDDGDLLGTFPQPVKNVIEGLDEMAQNTLRTALLVEYARCTKMPSASVVRALSGINFSRTAEDENVQSIMSSFRSIKRKGRQND